MNKFLLISFIIFLFLTFTAFGIEPVFKLGNGNTADLQLMPECEIKDGHFFADNKTNGAIIPNSVDWHLGDGFTVAATINLKRRHPNFGNGYGKDGGFLYDHDIIASKGTEFVFGRRSDHWCDQLYFNFKRDGKWSVPLVGTTSMPPYGTFAHVAIVVRRSVVDFRGFDGYVATYYVNGEPEKEQQINCGGPVDISDAPWTLGSGLGVRDDQWSFGGEMTDVTLFQTALNDSQIMMLAVASTPARVAKFAGAELTEEFTTAVENFQKDASEFGKWGINALVLDAKNGALQPRIQADITRLAEILKITDADKFATQWNKTAKGTRIFYDKRSLLLVTVGPHNGGYPILGWYDTKHHRELFANTPPAWELKSHLAGSRQNVLQNAAGTPFTVTLGQDNGVITWRTEDKLEAVSNFTFRNGRLEMDFRLTALNDELLLDQVTFPQVQFACLHNGTDRLLYPKMSGVVFDNPITNEVPQPWKNYPNGELNMQFHAYYDDLGGVYVAQEDPFGGCKRFQARGRNGALEMQWTHPVGYDAKDAGGRSFTLSGPAVIELFDGDWYDAGRIYRRFLSDPQKGAKWWIPSLPRENTPKWMRENTLWILQLCFNEWDWYNTVSNLKELRQYFELPFGLHYYEWFDRTKGEFPHFHAKPSALQTLMELSDAGIYVKPYTDNRTWARDDGLAPGKDHKDCIGFIKAENGHYDFQFKRVAESFATRNQEGELTLEGGGTRCAVMCPSVPEWQDYIVNMARRLAGQGFHAIYHDEVTTAQPIQCFNANHGHRLNDQHNWMNNGYWKMFEKIADLRSKYPNLCHDSEDADEVMLGCLDGVCPFRWVDPGQVPLFCSIYSGRIQFNGRIYDHHTPGEKESFYDKMAVQLVNSEQLGWFTADFMNDPQRRLYAKCLMHLRHLMLPYFNEGEMLHPLKFSQEIPTRTLTWGCLGTYRITNPKVLHCIFARPDGTAAALFVNASPEELTIHPLLPAEYSQAFDVNSEKTKSFASGDAITLAGRGFAMILLGKKGVNLHSEQQRLQTALARIRAFTPGKVRHEIFNNPQTIPSDGLHYDFEDQPVWHTQPAYLGLGCYEIIGHPIRKTIRSFQFAFEKNTTYELEIAIRKDIDTESLMRVCNYNKDSKISTYAVFGEDIPADGVWHHCKITFTTDDQIFNSALYFYLEPTEKTLRIDELKIRKVKTLANKNIVKINETPSTPKKSEQHEDNSAQTANESTSADNANCIRPSMGNTKVAKLEGNGRFLYQKETIPAVPGAQYAVSFEMRKTGELSRNPIEHRMVISLEKAAGGIMEFMYAGEEVPVDGQWHTVNANCTIPADPGKITIFVYNANAEGTLEIRNLELRKK